MIILPIMGLVRRLLCQRINNAPEFVRNCKNDMAKDSLHLSNPDDFTLSIIIGEIFDSFRIALNSANYRISLQKN